MEGLVEKAIIYCFSGTGNTLKVANFIKDNLEKLDISTDVFSIDYESYKAKSYPSPNNYDKVGIAYPIYGFNAPYLVNRFVKFLEKAKKSQKVFIIKTSGEPFKMNNLSSGIMKRHLKHKGYDVFYEKHYLMPYNIMFRYPDGLVKQMYETSEKYSCISANRIKNEERELLKGNVGAVIMGFICKLVWPGGPIIGRTFRPIKKKCTKCSLCIKRCPMKNISVNKKNGFPKFGGHCAICMRCVMNCPANAINAGIMNEWKVNPKYPFEEILKNEEICDNFVNEDTKGYFKLFLKYFKRMNNEIDEFNTKLQ